MRRNVLFLVLCLFAFQQASAQIYYETSWTATGTQYTGLLIYYDDDDALMRVKYKINDNFKVAEFKCFGEYFEEDDFEGYLLDGQDAKVVYGNDGNTYSADNFIFIDIDGEYSTPLQIDDNGLKSPDVENYLIEVDSWKEITTDKFTESYVYSFFEKHEPLYKTLVSYNIQDNPVNTSSGNYKITSLTNGSGEWAVTMSKGTDYLGQTWKTSASYPNEWIKEKWAEDYDISALSYGSSKWAMVMTKGTGYTTQTWKLSTSFPDTWVSEKWDESYDITSVSFGAGEWALVMSKGSGYSTQSWKTSKSFPNEWIKEKWDQSYDITSVAYGNGLWAVVMSKGTGFATQSWKSSNAYPNDWIKEKWDNSFDITSHCNGNGLWITVMSKGSGYTTQTWKTSSSYPNEWIKEKWDGQSTTSPVDEPEIVQNSRLHLIVACNTLIPDIGTSCSVDRNNTVSEFEIICEELEIPIIKTVVDDKRFNKQTLSTALSNLNPGYNDIVVFVYSGHGYRWSNQESQYPNIDLRYSSYQSVSEQSSYNLANIYNTITEKGARLNIIIGDCCNSDIGMSNRGGEPSLASRRQSQGKVEKLRKLFLQSRGNLIAAAAQANETSCGNSRDGGYFISSFFAALSKETSRLSGDYPSWENIVTRAISSANYKTRSLSGCDPQNGIYYSTVD